MNESNRNLKPDPAREEALFQAAAQLSGDKRASFLNGACHGDPALRQRLEALLAAHEQTDAVLATELESGLLRSEASARQARAATMLELTDAPDEAVGQILGRYKLLEKVGEGGCGVVYVAEQTEPVRRRVALKVIKLGMDTKAVVARFEAERQALAMMDHPNIAKALDAGTTEAGRPYFVMELVRGIRITDYCDQANLSAKERIDLFIKVCQAIQHAHQKGIIHRDIKPSNILVTLHDGVPVPKVIDFGIAKATEGRLTDATVYTQLHQFIGTPAYMSPEQAEMSGLDIDTRSDIYSLGVLLYELLAGSTPFDAKELMAAGIDAMRKTIREQEPVRPSTRLATLKGEELTTTAKRRSCDAPKLIHLLKGDLDWIVMKCLEKDRVRRYETANGLAADLTRHLHNEPVIARPPSKAYRFQKMVRRNTLAFAAGTAVGVAVLAGLGVSTFLFVQERRAHHRAITAELEQSRLRKLAEVDSNQAKHEAERAEAAATEVKMTMSASDFALAARLIEENEKSDALAYLTRSLRFNLTNYAVATRLATLLASQPWWVPVTVFKPGQDIKDAQFSPDGNQIVTALGSGAMQVWDARSGQPSAQLIGSIHVNATNTSGSLAAAGFSQNGNRIVSISKDGSLRSWDARSGQPLGERAGQTPGDNVFSVQLSADARRFLMLYRSGHAAAVWDTTSGQMLAELKASRALQGAQFSPDAGRVVTTSFGAVQVWDAQSGLLVSELKIPAGRVEFGAQFSPDGKRIVTASMGGTTQIWDAQSGQPVTEPIKHSSGVSSARFSPDGKRILTASMEGSVRLWDSQSGLPLSGPLKHNSFVSSAQFSPDGKRLLTISEDIVRIWETIGGPSAPESIEEGRNYCQFSPDGKWLLTSLWSNGELTMRVTEVSSGRPVGEPFKALMTPLVTKPAVRFSPDDEKVVIISDDNSARVWDVRTGQPLTPALKHLGSVESAEFSPDGTKVLTASYDKTAQVWDVLTGQALSWSLKHSGPVISARFSPDGRRIATASFDGTARLWDSADGQPLNGPLNHLSRVESARFSPDSGRIVTASWDGTARVWDARTGHPLTEPLKHANAVTSAVFSRDGKRVITASYDGTGRVWDAWTGKPVTGPLRLGGSVNSAEFSPNGKLAVTASMDHTARVWDAVTGQPLTERLIHSNMVLSAQFSPDGKRVLTSSVGAAMIWDIAPAASPIPEWLPRLAEAISGETLGSQGILEPTQLDRAGVLQRLGQKLNEEQDDNDWAQWGRWILAQPSMRTISPFSRLLPSGW